MLYTTSHPHPVTLLFCEDKLLQVLQLGLGGAVERHDLGELILGLGPGLVVLANLQLDAPHVHLQLLHCLFAAGVPQIGRDRYMWNVLLCCV